MFREAAKDFQGIAEIPGPTKVNGVRVYTSTAEPAAADDQGVFYSRRGDGPYYRWLYEATAARWRVARVIDAAFTRQALSLATWKNIPVALQTRLGEHYLE
ncbi:MAG TPA: hypothetical protein VJU86_14570 [Pyrinomonadaceae bacterium]|nr:hypothetical protein [Pyrinomonadaceae bacterium]